MTPLNSIITSGKTFHLIALLTVVSLLSFCVDKYLKNVGVLTALPILVSTILAIVSLLLLIKDKQANQNLSGISAAKNDFVFVPQLIILLLLV